MTNNTSHLKSSAIEFVSGGTAGFIEVALMHPLDLVKTRLQLQIGPPKKNDPNFYTGIIDCFTKLYKDEGIMSFWKGLLPPLIIETPTKSVRFTSFHFYKDIFMKKKPPSLLTYVFCGYCAGFTESFVICPFEVVKITQQSNRARMSKVPSAWKTATAIIQEDGMFGKRGIYRGLGATIYRHTFFCAVYLGLFYPARSHFPPTGKPFRDFLNTFTIGVLTSSFGCVCNIPFDVVKSRIQAPQPKKLKYKNTWQSILTVAQEEGYGALYKGLLAKVLRLGPGGAIMIIVFEFMQDYLERLFPD